MEGKEIQMNEDEFEVLDELYFVTSHIDLEKILNWPDEKLTVTLESLLTKKWIRVLSDPEKEIIGTIELRRQGKTYFYLASKKGLMAHNTA